MVVAQHAMSNNTTQGDTHHNRSDYDSLPMTKNPRSQSQSQPRSLNVSPPPSTPRARIQSKKTDPHDVLQQYMAQSELYTHDETNALQVLRQESMQEQALRQSKIESTRQKAVLKQASIMHQTRERVDTNLSNFYALEVSKTSERPGICIRFRDVQRFFAYNMKVNGNSNSFKSAFLGFSRDCPLDSNNLIVYSCLSIYARAMKAAKKHMERNSNYGMEEGLREVAAKDYSTTPNYVTSPPSFIEAYVTDSDQTPVKIKISTLYSLEIPPSFLIDLARGAKYRACTAHEYALHDPSHTSRFDRIADKMYRAGDHQALALIVLKCLWVGIMLNDQNTKGSFQKSVANAYRKGFIMPQVAFD